VVTLNQCRSIPRSQLLLDTQSFSYLVSCLILKRSYSIPTHNHGEGQTCRNEGDLNRCLARAYTNLFSRSCRPNNKGMWARMCLRLSFFFLYILCLHRNSYPMQASGNGGNAYQGGRRPNPYAQQDDRAYEMSDVRDSTTHLAPASPATAGGGDMAAFYSEVRSSSFFSTLGTI
jgi:hypothetical protein